MNAWVLERPGELRLGDIDMPVPGEGEVLVRVKAAGICGSDIPRAFVTGSHRMPMVIGHEFSGEVVDSGRRVAVFPLLPCMECEACRDKKYELCRHYNYLGSRCDGGFAEYVSVPEWNLMDIPDEVSYREAAMMEPMSVAAHAMRRTIDIKNADRNAIIVVYGLGTIGLLLTMLLVGEGFKNIFVIGNKEFQREQIVRLGIDESNYYDNVDIRRNSPTEESNEFDREAKKAELNNWLLFNTAGHGADYVFECVGKSETAEQSVEMAAAEGRVMLMGNPYSDITFSRNIYWKILRNQLTLIGTWNSSYTKSEDDDWHYVMNALKRGMIKPEQLITHEFGMEALFAGFEIMRDKSEPYIKIMMTADE